MLPFEDVPWWLWPIEFELMCSLGTGPALVFFWGLNTNFSDLDTWWKWVLWFYFGIGGGLALLINHIRRNWDHI